MRNFRLAGEARLRRDAGESLPCFPTDRWDYDETNSDAAAFRGWVFQDSDVYKWLEAVGYVLAQNEAPALHRAAQEAIELICNAQMADGYLDTFYIINNPNARFTNLKDKHELYCFGHLCEAAISYTSATGEKMLLDTACRFADLLCGTFGKTGRAGYPGHPIAEMALVRLYEATHRQRYLDLASFFVRTRGEQPFFFDTERGTKTDGYSYRYNQAHLPCSQQYEAVGHAVRGVYLYSGMADVARLTDDDGLLAACDSLFQSISQQKMYITGGIGATADGEAFSFPYDLPNDTAYAETCAAIGLFFFAYRMLRICPDSRYADCAERALYNGALSGMSQDGKRFFYVNPLSVYPTACHADSRLAHVKTIRQPWFGCACCPPNLARLTVSVGRYCVTEHESTVFLHLYAAGQYKTANGILTVQTDFPEGETVTVSTDRSESMQIALRVPDWTEAPEYTQTPYKMENGYAYFSVSSDVPLHVRFPMPIRLMRAHTSVREDIGKAAVQRGPFVYCLEEADNGKNLHLLSVAKSPNFKLDGETITADGFRLAEDAQNALLYSEYNAFQKCKLRLRFVPYYTWNNRGEGEMLVFVPMDGGF